MAGRRAALAGVTMMLVAVLAACGGGGGGQSTGHGASAGAGGHHAPQDDRVTGLRDAVRHVARRTARGSRPHLVRVCKPVTRKVRHTQRRSGRKRTWYTTERTRSCRKVRRGRESYTRVVRQERWCVRLDRAAAVAAGAGKGGTAGTGRDDVWYRVSAETYSEVHGVPQHRRVTFDPLAAGC